MSIIIRGTDDTITATDGSLSMPGVQLDSINATGNINAVGIITASSFVGNGSSLTGINVPSSYSELDGMLFG